MHQFDRFYLDVPPLTIHDARGGPRLRALVPILLYVGLAAIISVEA